MILFKMKTLFKGFGSDTCVKCSLILTSVFGFFLFVVQIFSSSHPRHHHGRVVIFLFGALLVWVCTAAMVNINEGNRTRR
jgi:hypothetical protein